MLVPVRHSRQSGQALLLALLVQLLPALLTFPCPHPARRFPNRGVGVTTGQGNQPVGYLVSGVVMATPSADLARVDALLLRARLAVLTGVHRLACDARREHMGALPVRREAPVPLTRMAALGVHAEPLNVAVHMVRALLRSGVRSSVLRRIHLEPVSVPSSGNTTQTPHQSAVSTHPRSTRTNLRIPVLRVRTEERNRLRFRAWLRHRTTPTCLLSETLRRRADILRQKPHLYADGV